MLCFGSVYVAYSILGLWGSKNAKVLYKFATFSVLRGFGMSVMLWLL